MDLILENMDMEDFKKNNQLNLRLLQLIFFHKNNKYDVSDLFS